MTPVKPATPPTLDLATCTVALIGPDADTESEVRAIFGPTWTGPVRTYGRSTGAHPERDLRAGFRQALFDALTDLTFPLLITLGPVQRTERLLQRLPPIPAADFLIIGGQVRLGARELQRHRPWHAYTSDLLEETRAVFVPNLITCTALLDRVSDPAQPLANAIDATALYVPSQVLLPPALRAAINAEPLDSVATSFAGVPIYWINLDRRADRRAAMEAALRDWQGPVQRISAIDGSTISAQEVAAYQAILSRVRGRPGERQLRGELGCTRSHQHAMRVAIAAGRYPFIVMEDDAMPSPDWWRDAPPPGWRIALLAGRPHHLSRKLKRSPGWIHLTDPRWVTTCAYAVYDRETATSLLHAWSEESAPADLLWRKVIGRVPSYTTAPRRIIARKSASDIHFGKPKHQGQTERNPSDPTGSP